LQAAHEWLGNVPALSIFYPDFDGLFADIQGLETAQTSYRWKIKEIIHS
jgi:hypothetical protein